MQKTVGISCGRAGDNYCLRQYYVQALNRVGLAALILPAQEQAAAAGLADTLDGLLLSGGDDFSPQIWGEYPHYTEIKADMAREGWELALLAEFLRRGKPILGICRGMQLINIGLGGSLWQDLAERPDTLEHWQSAPPEEICHQVRCRGELAGWLGLANGGKIGVNSVHHQAVRRLGRGLRALAVAEDGVIEAIGRAQGGFCLGVQWHPERLKDNLAIWQAFAKKIVEK